MPHFKLKVIAAVTLSICAAGAQASDVLRCGSRLVSTEALAADVLGACGDPDFVDRWDPPDGTVPAATLADIEEWYYNFGPAQLLRVLHFQHGRLTDIESDGHGFGKGLRSACGPYEIIEGFSKYRLELTCGDPVTRRVEYAVLPLQNRHSPYLSRNTTYVYLEEWVYNFGASNMLRVVTLVNGRVTDVHSEGRGFNPR